MQRWLDHNDSEMILINAKDDSYHGKILPFANAPDGQICLARHVFCYASGNEMNESFPGVGPHRDHVCVDFAGKVKDPRVGVIIRPYVDCVVVKA